MHDGPLPPSPQLLLLLLLQSCCLISSRDVSMDAAIRWHHSPPCMFFMVGGLSVVAVEGVVEGRGLQVSHFL